MHEIPMRPDIEIEDPPLDIFVEAVMQPNGLTSRPWG